MEILATIHQPKKKNRNHIKLSFALRIIEKIFICMQLEVDHLMEAPFHEFRFDNEMKENVFFMSFIIR